MRIAPTLASLLSLVTLAEFFVDPVSAAPPQVAGADTTERCTALGKVDFSTLPDAVTQVIESHLKGPSDKTPSYCEVSGYVAPSIRFKFRLPSESWNGKFIELGCGGTCGTLEHVSGCDDPLRRGYACIVSDGGNSSSGEDMKWAHNNPEAVIQYVVRASHVTAIVGKVIAERYYEKPPLRSYFMGCSAGGLQAMTEAQRFPWDFDGIVAGDPDLSIGEDWMNMVWVNRVLADQVLTERDLETLHRAVVAECDLNDGVKDGVIGDPRVCKFRPEELSCTSQKEERCFSSPQINAIRKIYGGPVTKTGTPIGTRHVFMGSELSWLDLFGGSDRAPTGLLYSYMPEWFRYYLFQPNPGPSWTIKDLDFDRDYRRFGIAELTDPVNPDLRRLKSANGKLISYTGWNDAAAGVGRTVDYYESTERLMGGRAKTQEFFRLFVVPGMNHCTGGDGAFFVDYLSYLEAWVENRQQPDRLLGAHLIKDAPDRQYLFGRRGPVDPAAIEFTRPIYPYPTRTKYLGHGDPRDAASFGPVKP